MCLNSKFELRQKIYHPLCASEFTAASEAVTLVLYCIQLNVYNRTLNWMLWYYSDTWFNSKHCRCTKAWQGTS